MSDDFMVRWNAARSVTTEQKRAIIERLLAAWMRTPEQRLGQLLVNASESRELPLHTRIFYVSDETLLARVEAFVLALDERESEER